MTFQSWSLPKWRFLALQHLSRAFLLQTWSRSKGRGPVSKCQRNGWFEIRKSINPSVHHCFPCSDRHCWCIPLFSDTPKWGWVKTCQNSKILPYFWASTSTKQLFQGTQGPRVLTHTQMEQTFPAAPPGVCCCFAFQAAVDR